MHIHISAIYVEKRRHGVQGSTDVAVILSNFVVTVFAGRYNVKNLTNRKA